MLKRDAVVMVDSFVVAVQTCYFTNRNRGNANNYSRRAERRKRDSEIGTRMTQDETPRMKTGSDKDNKARWPQKGTKVTTKSDTQPVSLGLPHQLLHFVLFVLFCGQSLLGFGPAFIRVPSFKTREAYVALLADFFRRTSS